MYVDAHIAMSDAFADTLQTEYDTNIAAGMLPPAAIIQANIVAEQYIQTNIATIVPGYDSSIIQQDVRDCYQAMLYDKFFYDDGLSPALALADSITYSSEMVSRCTDLAYVNESNNHPCLNLLANGRKTSNNFLVQRYQYLTNHYGTHCPLVDMRAHDNALSYHQFNG